MDPTSLLFAPSTVHMFAVTAAPLTERSEPPSRPLSFTLRTSGALTPGMRVASWRKLRPFRGSSRTCSPVMRPATSPPVVDTDTAGVSTFTVSVTLPVVSWTSNDLLSATFKTILLRDSPLKPGYSTSSR